MKIYTIGHLSPDLDSFASATAYAEYLKLSARYQNAEIVPLRTGNPNKEAEYIFSKFNLNFPVLIDEINIDAEDRFVLVDHNEDSQRHPKIPNEQIIEVIDHHKINVNFSTPVRIEVKPYGCTCTLIYENMKKENITPNKEIAGLILSAIISDTVGLKSSTTTGIDSDTAREICESHHFDFDNFVFEVFKAKADLSGLTSKELLSKDSKVFDFNGKKALISQVETVEPEKLLEMKKDLLEELATQKDEKKVDYGFLFITDILKLYSLGLYNTEEERLLLEKSFTARGEDNTINIGPRISRKKDIAPAIEKSI